MFRLNEYLVKEIIDTINLYLDSYSKQQKLDFLIDLRDTSVVFCKNKYIKLKFNSKRVHQKMIYNYGVCEFSKYWDATNSFIAMLNENYANNAYMNRHKELIESTTF